jgi:hypothetical protein
MPESPTAPSPDVQRLIDEGYAVSIDNGYLIVDNVPYVLSANTIGRGALICAYSQQNGLPQVNGDHTVWFTGSAPCQADGTSLENVLIADKTAQTIAGRQVLCRLSNKPNNLEEMLANFYNKLIHYIRKLTSYSRVIDPTVNASGTGAFTLRQKPSVFFYPNPAIARSGLDAYDDKLIVRKVAIVGLGGTGSYILDALAKTPAQEIHLYDHDVVDPGFAYRSPGGMGIEQAHGSIQKTDYLRDLYSVMRTGISSHPVRIEETNVHELNNCDFVFIAIDNGPSRGLIARHLATKGIPFIDVGIGVDKVAENVELLGRARVTLVEQGTGHLVDKLPTADDQEDVVYNNVQVLELNAINAMLAMIKYKQVLGFYADETKPVFLKYVTSWSGLRAQARGDLENPEHQA